MFAFKPKIFFSDLDGTFLDNPKAKNEKEKVSHENIEAARALNDAGIPFILATGRSNSDFVLWLTNEIHAPYAICQNGGIIVDKNNNVLKKEEMRKDTVMRVVDVLKKERMCFIFNSSNKIYGPSGKMKIMRNWIKKLERYNYDNMPQFSDSTKILTFGKLMRKNIIKVKDELKANFINLAFHIVSRGYAIEINDINATKGKAEQFICKIMNIDPSFAVHFGDSGNDTTTIPYIGAFIAMKNSQKNIKKQAALVTYGFKKSGVAKALKQFKNTI
ncbi:Cof-type HAD-IIB family hydrolase [Metamycoplasma neophronis]|uniref:HAD family phosphatase n=1 Tax=Metamycoplasma neophronis TaxID=872983 RepID=A0ABY2Z4W2_9BACT|nr:Cof-type HAD-IIB family hydrolase [Metamycoplasma neophronis]TPR54721.1 HAD family phosphatase [Metamycoplasma neophronis]